MQSCASKFKWLRAQVRVMLSWLVVTPQSSFRSCWLTHETIGHHKAAQMHQVWRVRLFAGFVACFVEQRAQREVLDETRSSGCGKQKVSM
jgi:hypothetical protein